uniref:Uncharacterized protein n=1 Tax=Arundo donax TaxID=35708 RepID=A0A0A9FPN4_ARUDO
MTVCNLNNLSGLRGPKRSVATFRPCPY